VIEPGAPPCGSPASTTERDPGDDSAEPATSGTIRSDCAPAPAPVIVIPRPPALPPRAAGRTDTNLRGPGARAIVDHANRKRLTEVTIDAARGGEATVVIGGSAPSTAAAAAAAASSRPRRPEYGAIQIRIDEAALRAIEDQSDGASVIVIAPTTAGSAVLRPSTTIAPGAVNDAAQKRLLEAAIRQAEDGKAVLFVPPPGRGTNAAGRPLPDRHGADRARLREAALKALREGRTDRTIIILDVPR